MPTHAPPSSPHAQVSPLPRASSVALTRQADARRAETRAASERATRRDRRPIIRRPRPLIAVVSVVLLLLSSFAAAPIQAAQRDVDPSAPTAFAAEEEPTPTPEPTPKPTPKPTPWPTPKGVKGLDVSHWNGYPNFDALHDQGMRFVFSKATQGTSFVDDTFKRHTREARAAGLLAGAYHFFDYRKGGKAQARHFLRIVRNTSGLSSLLPLVVDVETLKSLGTPNKAKAKQRLHGLIDELYAQTGRYPMIYTSRSMWERVVGSPTSFGQYRLWVACWKCDTVWLPRGWSDWDFWQVGQFKFKGGVKLDGNMWSATMSDLKKIKQRPMNLANGAEWATAKAVQADLRGFEGTQVRYAAAGGTWGPWQPYAKRFGLQLAGKQGKQDVKVQLRSFRGVRSPVITDTIRLDSVAPKVWGPRIKLRQGVRVQKSGARIPTVVDMSASDATSGLASTSLKTSCRGRERAATYSLAAKPKLTVQIDKSGCTLVGNAADAVGLRSTSKLTPSVKIVDLRRSNPAVEFGKGWTILGAKASLGKSLARAAKKEATVKVRIDGAQFAIVARKGPAGGKFKVLVDGKHVDTIDLYAGKGDARRVVYVRDVPRGVHTIKLRATGTSRGASRGANVWLDALLVLDRRK